MYLSDSHDYLFILDEFFSKIICTRTNQIDDELFVCSNIRRTIYEDQFIPGRRG